MLSLDAWPRKNGIEAREECPRPRHRVLGLGSSTEFGRVSQLAPIVAYLAFYRIRLPVAYFTERHPWPRPRPHGLDLDTHGLVNIPARYFHCPILSFLCMNFKWSCNAIPKRKPWLQLFMDYADLYQPNISALALRKNASSSAPPWDVVVASVGSLWCGDPA